MMLKKPVFGIAIFACFGWAQAPAPARQLTARELFYASAPAAPVKAPAAAKPAAAKTAAKPSEAKTSRKPQRPGTDTTPAAVSARQSAPPPSTNSKPALPGGAQYTQAAYPPGGATSAIPLGLRYTILKLVDGRMTPVTPDTVFHAGDRIQVSVEANDSGYLYIVHQGASGTWKPLFPSAEVEDGNNRIERGRTYVMPPKSRFYFDEQAGEEKLFVVFSRQPEADLEKLIYNLQDGGRKPAPAPASDEPARRPPPVMLASNRLIDDSLVGRLRNVYARDLVVEKVDDEAEPPAGRQKEKAVYVVNPTGSPDSRVVADIRLTHR